MTPSVPTVLVVDDNDTKRYVIGSWLRRAGYDVVEAATGQAALEQAAAHDVDVAVLDVHLPDMSGLDVCRALKTRPSSAATPVLHVSAVAVEAADRAAGLDQGADAYLTDPIEPQEFLSTVKALLRQGQARRKAEQLAARLEQLSIATLRINVSLNAARLATSAADGAAGMFDGPAAAILRDESGAVVSAVSAGPGHGVSVTTLAPETAPVLLEAIESGTVAGPRPEAETWARMLPAAEGGRVWHLTPVRERAEHVVGAILYAARPVEERIHDDRVLVRQLAQSVAVAHENLRVFAAEHRIALTLQRSLLPASLPPLPGLAVAARYRASTEQAEIGGDFFDAFETPDGGAVIVIGDVQGHSLSAAVVMAELRYSLRAYAFDGHGPAEVIGRLNRLLVRGHPETTATICTVTLSPDRALATVVNAGHIPPLVVADGRARFLDAHGLMLGVDDAAPAQPVVVELPAHARLLLTTDGLVERRDTALDTNLEKLAVAVLQHRGDLEALSDELMARYGNTDDDVALVVAQVDRDVR